MLMLGLKMCTLSVYMGPELIVWIIHNLMVASSYDNEI